MTALEALQSVQFVTVKGQRVAVVNAEDWEALIEWLEQVEDIAAVRQALTQLQAANFDRAAAGWQKWDDIEEQLA